MEKIFLHVLNMSLTGSYVILAVLLIRLLLKKAPANVSFCLWFVVAFRLVCPFTIESAWSLLPFSATPIPENLVEQAGPSIDSGITAINDFVSPSLSAGIANGGGDVIKIAAVIAAYAWVVVSTGMIMYGLVSYILLRRKYKRLTPDTDGVYRSDSIKTPFVLGFMRPRIFLPRGLTEKENEFILLHERTHIRRRDPIHKFAAFIILSLHWFNPLVWLAFWLFGKDMERSCDEAVIREYGSDIKKEYSRSLLSLSMPMHAFRGSPLAFSEVDVKERIKNVLRWKKPKRLVWIVSIVLLIAVSVGFGMNRWMGVGGSPERTPENTLDEALFQMIQKFESDKMTDEKYSYNTYLAVELEDAPDGTQRRLAEELEWWLEPYGKKSFVGDFQSLTDSGDMTYTVYEKDEQIKMYDGWLMSMVISRLEGPFLTVIVYTGKGGYSSNYYTVMGRFIDGEWLVYHKMDVGFIN